MTAQLSPQPVFKGWANDGTPLAYGLLTTWAAGTTTPQATYIDSTQTTPNTNPIILDARGECALWLDPTLSYKFNLTDKAGNHISRYPVDNIQGFAQLPIDSLNIHYDITASEIAASVTPTNYAIPSHASIGVVLLERYGGIPNNAGAGATNDAAIVSALNVAAQLDAIVAITAGTWDFNSPWPTLGLTGNGGRVRGLGLPYIRFKSTISATLDLVTMNHSTYGQCELRDLKFDAQTGGRDEISVQQVYKPIIDNVWIYNSGRHALAFNCQGTNQWVSTVDVNVFIITAGAAAFAFLLGGNNSFINEGVIQAEVRGWSKTSSGWPCFYFNGTGVSSGNSFADLCFYKTNIDMQYNTGDANVPSFDALQLIGNCPIVNMEFQMAGWENTGSFGPPNTGTLFHNSGTSGMTVWLKSFERGGWFGAVGVGSVTVLGFEDTGLGVVQIQEFRAGYGTPLRANNTRIWEPASAVINLPRNPLSMKYGSDPSADTDGVPLSGTLMGYANIATSSSGNIDFPNALIPTANYPNVQFCHSFTLTLQSSQFASNGNQIMRVYMVIVRPDGATVVALQVADNSTANEIASVAFSIVSSTTLRVAITTGTAHGSSGGYTSIYGTLLRGTFQ